MNVGCFISGLLPTLFVESVGVVNMVIFSAVSTTAIIFSMVALKDLASALVITVLFGLCVGICESSQFYAGFTLHLNTR